VVAQPLKTAEMTRANTGMVYFIIEILNKINKPVVVADIMLFRHSKTEPHPTPSLFPCERLTGAG
jgi:hypothetical protein